MKDRTHLLESARRLHSVGESACDEYSARMERLVTRINTLMLDRKDIEELVGSANVEVMKDNHANHVRFIASMLRAFNAEVLVETVLWVFRTYRSRGFYGTYWAAQLNGWMKILPEELTPETFAEILPYYEWMHVNIPLFVELSAENVVSDEPEH